MVRTKPRPYVTWAKEDLRKWGYEVDNVERRNCWSGTTNDLFGFGDLLAIKRGKTPSTSRRIIVQVTGPHDHNARKKKILGLPVRGVIICRQAPKNARLALQCGFEILVVSYRKLKGKWEMRVEEIKLEDFKV